MRSLSTLRSPLWLVDAHETSRCGCTAYAAGQPVPSLEYMRKRKNGSKAGGSAVKLMHPLIGEAPQFKPHR